MKAWGTACGAASVAGLSLLFSLHGLSGLGLGILALGGWGVWASGGSRSSGLQLVLVVGLSAFGALYGLPTLELVVVVVLALMGYEFSQSNIVYRHVADVDAKVVALHRRQVISLGALACASGVASLAWHVQVGFWWSLGLALALLAVFSYMLRQSA